MQISDNDVRLAIYRSFVDTGRAPVPAEVAAILGLPTADTEAAYRRLADAHVLVLAPGTPYIWLANPLSAAPSPFTVHTHGRDWHAVCIWDALGIIAMLGEDGHESGSVQTWCPDCDERLELDVRGGEVSVRSGEAVVHFSVPARHWWDDIGFT